VGVVKDARRDQLREQNVLQYFVPLAQGRSLSAMRVLLVSSDGSVEALMPRLRHALQTLAPNLPYPDVQALGEIVGSRSRPWRVGAVVLTSLGALALLLATLGLYSVLAHQVASRRREFGVRLALGASKRGVMTLVLRRATGMVGLGTAVGATVALIGSPFVGELLFEVSATEVTIYGLVVAALLAAAVLASVIPVIAATRVSPMEALRSDLS
jgi:ABC-type antimicrobial peptide transport system permease subunit